MVRESVIAILSDSGNPLPGPAKDALDGIRIFDLARLSAGDLENVQPVAVLHFISEATDSLHQEAKRLSRAEESVPLISYSDGGADEALAEKSRRLGCIAHLRAPLSRALLEEVVPREVRLAKTEQALAECREEAQREHQKLTQFIEIIKTANTVLEPARVMEAVMNRARDSLSCELWCLFLTDERKSTLVMERTGDLSLRVPEGYSMPVGQGVEGEVMRSGRALIVNDYPADARFDPAFDRLMKLTSRSVLVVPLISRSQDIGVVRLVNRIPGPAFSPADEALATLLMEPAAIALENAILFKKMEQLTVTDDLTQLYNVRHLNHFLYREIKRSQRYRLPLALIFLDMDGFKTVNDRYGHIAGSQTLAEVGRLLSETVREIDTVCRYGGDEFIIVLPQTDAQGAAVIAERLRQRIEQATFLNGMGLAVRLTASLGVSVFPEHGATRNEMIHKADAAMYRVKESGKNRILMAW